MKCMSFILLPFSAAAPAGGLIAISILRVLGFIIGRVRKDFLGRGRGIDLGSIGSLGKRAGDC